MEGSLEDGAGFAGRVGFRLDFTGAVALPEDFEQVTPHRTPLPLALWSAPRGIQLEIVDHAERAPGVGGFTGVFGCPPPKGAGDPVSRPALADAIAKSGAAHDPRCLALEPHGTETWFDAAGGPGGLRAVVCRVRDVAAEAAFWERLAEVHWDSVTATTAWGTMPSAMPRGSCVLVLARDETAFADRRMNDTGFPSIGVLTTEIEADYARALALGATARSAPIPATVGGRRLRLALFASPGGVLVEPLAAGWG
ncbi:VOC family protein [Streptomyces puniciscabiei]